jgi:hypothetical protein
VLAGLASELSASSLQRAAAGTYSLVKDILTADGEEPALTEDARVRRIRAAAPDVVCVAGGTDGGATTSVLQLVEAAALACSLVDRPTRPLLLYAGNAKLRERVAKMIDGRLELRVADNVRPSLTEEYTLGCGSELDAIYLTDKMGQLPGLDILSSWSPIPLVPTARAFGRLIEYLWHLGDKSRGVLGIDVGGASTTLAAVFDGELFLSVRSDLGMAFGAERLVEGRRADSVLRWLPEQSNAAEIRGALINKQARPASIPQDERELWIEQALAREIIRSTLALARPGWMSDAAQLRPGLLPLCDTVVASGGVLAHAPRPAQAALMILDALQPIGVTKLVLDAHGLAPALGHVAAIKPVAAVEALATGGFIDLATVVAPVGRARRGETAIRVGVKYDHGGEVVVEVRCGEIEVVPLMPGSQATLELRPARRFDVGLGGPGRGGKRRIDGGLVGLIIDARGRPLFWSRSEEQRRQQVQQWLWDVGG